MGSWLMGGRSGFAHISLFYTMRADIYGCVFELAAQLGASSVSE
jgi:hypothetical protein